MVGIWTCRCIKIMKNNILKYLGISVLCVGLYFVSVHYNPSSSPFGKFLDENTWIKAILMIVIVASLLSNLVRDSKNK